MSTSNEFAQHSDQDLILKARELFYEANDLYAESRRCVIEGTASSPVVRTQLLEGSYHLNRRLVDLHGEMVRRLRADLDGLAGQHD